MKKKYYFIFPAAILAFLTILVLTFETVISAENSVPKLINYQGYMTDQNGKALTGNYKITFRLYNEASGISAWLWQETHDSLTVISGQFNVLLGSATPLSASDFDGDRYLGIQVAGEVEMTPRMQLVSVAYSLQAENTNTMDNLRIIRGSVDPNGDIKAGTGFTISRVGTGLYQINFSKSFTASPSGSVTQVYPNFDDFGVGGMTGDNAVFVGINKDGAKVKTGNNDGNAVDRCFTFIIIGP